MQNLFLNVICGYFLISSGNSIILANEINERLQRLHLPTAVVTFQFNNAYEVIDVSQLPAKNYSY